MAFNPFKNMELFGRNKDNDPKRDIENENNNNETVEGITRREALLEIFGLISTASVLSLDKFLHKLKEIGDKIEKEQKCLREGKKEEVDEKEISTEEIKVEINENMKAEDISEEMLRVFMKPAVIKKMPKEIFNSDFFIAQQFQESRFNKKATSSMGAKGVYQNLPDSIIEVVRYLDNLRKKREIDYKGPKNIDDEMARKIKNSLGKKEDWGRAAGKLYLLSIYDPDYKFNQQPNNNVFAGKTSKEVQKLLLIAYHDGPKARVNSEKCSQNAKNYCHLVFNFMAEIKEIRKSLAEINFSGEEDYAVMKILKKLDNYRGHGQDKKKKVITRCVEKINNHRKENTDFSYDDLDEILS